MKNIIITVISLFSLQFSYSQIHEIGIFFGGSNFIGDVGEPKYINPNQPALGAIYKWNKSPKHSWRVSAIHTELEIFKDEETKTVTEISAGFEYNFLDFNLHHISMKKHTPYLFTGISALNYKNTYTYGAETKEDKEVAIGIPMVFGYKIRVSRSFNLAAEIGARYTFSDNIDGSHNIDDSDPNNIIDNSFGNLNNNDWYMFSGVTLTYTFGRNPCYCSNRNQY